MSEHIEEVKKNLKDNITKLITAHKTAEAKALLQQYQTMVHDDVEAISMAAVLAAMDKNFPEAEKFLQKGLTIDPNNFDLLFNLAYLCELQADYYSALKGYMKITESGYTDKQSQLAEDAIKRLKTQHPECEQQKVKPKMVFFVKAGMDSFLDDIIQGVSDEYESKKVIVSDLRQIDQEMQAADICWFEWCDELIIYGSKLQLAKQKKIICRLHRYEAFSDYPRQVVWDHVDEVIFVAEHIRDVVVDKVNLSPDKCHVVYNGINLGKFTYANRQKGFNLAWIGYLNLRKNPMLVIQYFHELVKADQRYHLYFAGSFQDEALMYYVRDMVSRLNLQNNIHFDGFIEHEKMNDWLKDKNYIVSGSIGEGHPVGIMEAMASGLKPAIHYFPGAESFYPKDFVYYDLDDFKRIFKEDTFNSESYRNFIANNYSFDKQIKMIKQVLNKNLSEPLIQKNAREATPLVTIGITNYNAEKYVKECIDSVLQQSYKNIEVIIVDDQSTDHSYQRLLKYTKKHKQIQLIRHQKNSGSPDLGRREIIAKAKGEYFMLFDSDDIFADRLAVEKLVTVFLNNRNIDYVYCNLVIVDEKTRKINEWIFEQYDRNRVICETFQRGGSGLLTMKGLFKKEFFSKNDISYLSNGTAGDTLTALLCMKKGMSIKHVNESLLAYRQHENNFTFDLKKRIESIVGILEYTVQNFDVKTYFPQQDWNDLSEKNYEANKYYLIAFLYYKVFQQYYSGQWKPWQNGKEEEQIENITKNLVPLRDLILSYTNRVRNITECYNKDIRYIEESLSQTYKSTDTFSLDQGPLISICLPTFNRAARLDKCLQSIYSQIGDDPYFEIVVSDNASGDNTAEIAASYAEKHGNFRYVRNQEDIGPERNLVNAMRHAAGKYVFAHSDDDAFVENSLQFIKNAILKNLDCNVIFINKYNNSFTFVNAYGLDEFLDYSSVYVTYFSFLILNRERLFAVEDFDSKERISAFIPQAYWAYAVLASYPKSLIINADIYYPESYEQPPVHPYIRKGGTWAEIFIKIYYDLLESFVAKGLSRQAITKDKVKLAGRSLWYFEQGLKNEDLLFFSTFEDLFDQYYRSEPHFEEFKSALRKIKEANPIDPNNMKGMFVEGYK